MMHEQILSVQGDGLTHWEQMQDAQKQCLPCKLCGGRAVITDAGEGHGYYIACENTRTVQPSGGCLINERRLGGWAYNVMEWWNRLHGTPMTPEPAQPAETWLNDPASLESGEPAQPAESPEARALSWIDVLREWFGGERYARDYEYLDANYRRQAEAVADYAALRAASTARPTERGAVEVDLEAQRQAIEACARVALPKNGGCAREGEHAIRKEIAGNIRALRPNEALALPATDQAAEVEGRAGGWC